MFVSQLLGLVVSLESLEGLWWAMNGLLNNDSMYSMRSPFSCKGFSNISMMSNTNIINEYCLKYCGSGILTSEIEEIFFIHKHVSFSCSRGKDKIWPSLFTNWTSSFCQDQENYIVVPKQELLCFESKAGTNY